MTNQDRGEVHKEEVATNLKWNQKLALYYMVRRVWQGRPSDEDRRLCVTVQDGIDILSFLKSGHLAPVLKLQVEGLLQEIVTDAHAPSAMNG